MGTNQAADLLPYMAAFARVVEAGSFSAAAREIGSTPSALSRQIARLEQRLG
ncbi:MAG TPA: transcriptional regulator, partial [Pseudomonas sp.]|nr:transcriptional regulator [Pseudomonas sp.]